MITSTPLSEAAEMAAYAYRKAEVDAINTDDVIGAMQLLMRKDPALSASINEGWTRLEASLDQHFLEMIPRTRRARALGKGPNVFEVHHTKIVARECFLLALHRQVQAGDQIDPEYASDFTLQRLGIVGNPEAFFQPEATPSPG